MSRVGRSPIPLPSGVEVDIQGRRVTVKGPKGTLVRDLPGEITVRRDDGALLVERPDDERHNRALHGLARSRRHRRVRKKVLGTPERPRLAVFRSNRHTVAPVIDDRAGRTLAAASTVEPELRAAPTGNREAAAKVGRLVAERAKAAGVTRVVFDRGGFLYHGRVAAVADAAREAGLEL